MDGTIKKVMVMMIKMITRRRRKKRRNTNTNIPTGPHDLGGRGRRGVGEGRCKY